MKKWILTATLIFSFQHVAEARSFCPTSLQTLQTIFKKTPVFEPEEISASLTLWTPEAEAKLLSEGPVNYVADLRGNYYLTSDPLPLSDSKVLVTKDKPAKVIVESGRVEVDPETGIAKKIQTQGESGKLAKVLECKQLTSASGKTAFTSYLKAGLGTTFVGLAVSEVSGSGRMFKNGHFDAEGARMVGSEMGNTILSTVVSAGVTSGLTRYNANVPVSFLVRTGSSFGMNRVNTAINEKVLTQNAGARSKKIQNFNDGYNLMRVPINHYFDRFLAKQLPAIAERACLNGSPLKIILSPTSLRVIERFANSALYYKSRDVIIGE